MPEGAPPNHRQSRWSSRMDVILLLDNLKYSVYFKLLGRSDWPILSLVYFE